MATKVKLLYYLYVYMCVHCPLCAYFIDRLDTIKLDQFASYREGKLLLFYP